MSIEVEIVRRTSELPPLRAEWDSLYAETPDASPYQCYEWIESEARDQESVGLNGLRVCVIRDAGQAVAILPLDVKRRREVPFPHSELRWAGGGWGTRLTAIVPPRSSGVPLLAAALDALGPREWDYCRLESVPRESTLLSQSLNGRFKQRTAALGRSIVIRLPSSWEAYRSTLSLSHRQNVSRRLNQLQRSGRVRLVRLGLDTIGNREALEVLMTDALSVSQKSWQGTLTSGGTAISTPRAVGFFRDVSRQLARRGSLDLSVLYLEDQPLSFTWGAAYWPRTTIAKLGFDPAFAKLSPGLAHLALLIQDSIRRSGLEIDYGHEFSEHKSHWSRDGDELCRVRVYGAAPLSRLLDAWHHRPDWTRRAYWRAAR